MGTASYCCLHMTLNNAAQRLKKEVKQHVRVNTLFRGTSINHILHLVDSDKGKNLVQVVKKQCGNLHLKKGV